MSDAAVFKGLSSVRRQEEVDEEDQEDDTELQQ